MGTQINCAWRDQNVEKKTNVHAEKIVKCAHKNHVHPNEIFSMLMKNALV